MSAPTAKSEFIAARRPYVNGKFIAGDGPLLDVQNPATEEVVAQVETCSLEQVEAAILAARESFDTGEWANASREHRVAVVNRMGDYFAAHQAQLSAIATAEVGFRAGDSGGPIGHVKECSELYLSLPDYEPNPLPYRQVIGGPRVGVSLRRYEPVGVVSAITAYNQPFWINLWKTIPALLTGNSVVLRPSPFTPLAALAFAEAADAAGLPPGVMNVVTETSFEGSELMTSHPAVDQISFTGSTAVGRQIMRQASDTIKRVILELGGKSVQLYLPDAIDKAPNGCRQVFYNAGQACVTPSRMLVPEEHKAEVLQALAEVTRSVKVGDPHDPDAFFGPLISAAQREKCEYYVAAAVAAGAKVIAGGRRPAGLAKGFYFEPTVLDVPDNSNPAARDEIFGPVLSVIGYRDLDHAVQIANDSIYGLSGQVFGRDLAAATKVAERIRSGVMIVNGGGGGLGVPYASTGGYKQSGVGRERGPEGIRSFQQMKNFSVGTLT